MKVLDLFSGLGGWTEAFRERGHETFSIDFDEQFHPDLLVDIMDITPDDIPWKPDIILASPPCEKFSVMTIGRYWNKDNSPKTEASEAALKLVGHTRWLINEINPTYFIMENPLGKLRKLTIMEDLERRTVTYCQLGEKYMKPTDLWGVFPPSLVLPPMCKRRATCHVSAKRGSKIGVQDTRTKFFRGGMIEDMARYPSWTPERKNLSALRAKIPYKLSLLVCEAAERDYESYDMQTGT